MESSGFCPGVREFVLIAQNGYNSDNFLSFFEERTVWEERLNIAKRQK